MSQRARPMKHTPGPWTPFIENNVVAVMKGRKEVIKWTGFGASDFPDDVEANARLVAAAPDMLAALKSVDHWFSVWTVGAGEGFDYLPEIQAAIAKATGKEGSK